MCYRTENIVCRHISASFSPETLQARAVEGLKGNQSEDKLVWKGASISICKFHSGGSVNIYSKEALVCIEPQLLGRSTAQPWWFALYWWRAEKGWLLRYLILLPHLPAFFMTLLSRVLDTKWRLSFCDFQTFLKTGPIIKQKNTRCLIFHSIPADTSLLQFPYISPSLV